MTTRELRVWHWKQALVNRKREDEHVDRAGKYAPGADRKYHLRYARKYRKAANLHMSAVQVLNDVCFEKFPELFVTAEQDLANGIGK